MTNNESIPTPIFAKVTAALRSPEWCVGAANAFSRAYEDGKYHDRDMELPGDVENVAINLAGLYATNDAATAVAVMRDGKISEEGYLQALRDISEDNWSESERLVCMLFAHATWSAGQPFRNQAKPLDRITREVMMHFGSLPEHERAKDVSQLHRGAKVLLDLISNS